MKNSLIKIFIFLLLTQGLFTNCTMQKRLHRKGYHVVWNHKYSSEHKKHPSIEMKELASTDKVISENVIVSADTDREMNLVFLKRKPMLMFYGDESSDSYLLLTAIKKDNGALKNKPIEVLEQQPQLKGKIKLAHKYTSKSDRIAFKLSSDKALIQKNSRKPTVFGKVNLLGLSSLISFIIYIIVMLIVFGYLLVSFNGILFLLGLFLSIIPLVMAYVSLFQFKHEPTKYTGKWMPIALVCFYLAIILFSAIGCAILSIWGWGLGIAFIASIALFFVLLCVFIAALTPKG